MIRASIESVPPIRRIKNREIDHLRKFSAAMRRSLPDRSEVDLYWGLHFALAMAHQTIRDSERLTKWSEGKCDLGDVAGHHRPRGRCVGDGADGRHQRQAAGDHRGAPPPLQPGFPDRRRSSLNTAQAASRKKTERAA